jgi:TRAP-type mannitol/chloroaromatic compound transport system substrate-binding protein
MKTKVSFVFVVILGLFLCVNAFAADSVIKWKMQSPFPPGLWIHQAGKMIVDDINRMSAGRLKIEYYSAGEIVPAFEIFNAVNKGTLDAGFTWPGYVIGKYPAGTLFSSTPAFFDMLGYYTWVYSGGGKELWQEMYGDAVKTIPSSMMPHEGGGWANKKITKMTDFKGLKYRTVLIWGQILAGYGASVVTLPMGEVVPSLQRGTLDAAEQSTPFIDLPLGFNEVAKYWYFPGVHQYEGFLEVIINSKKWADLPDDLKAIVESACAANMSKAMTRWAMGDAETVQKIKGLGKVEFVRYSPEMQKEILKKFVEKYDEQKDPMFKKVWKSQKDFLKLWTPYQHLQKVAAEVNVQ